MESNPLIPFEYTSIYFKEEDEEHLIPRHLVDKIPKLAKIINDSFDNSASLKGVEPHAFSHLVRYISEDKLEHEAPLPEMIKVAKELEMSEAEAKLTDLFWRLQDTTN